jgi:hypothetical protein
MKLLAKSDIHQKKTAEQKQTLDEGKKLASSIDRLREVAAQEESSLEKFRSETLASIHKETSEAATQRDALLGEVRELQLARQKALEPLTSELNLLEETREELAQKAAHNVETAATLDAWEQSLIEKYKEVTDTILRAETKEESARVKMEEIIRLEESTKQASEETRKLRDEVETIRNTLQGELVHREQMCTNRETSIILREETLEQERKAIQEEKIRLDDRSRTLERAFNRLNK